MAINGADSARVNRVLTTTLDHYAPQISNELKRNDGIIALFGARSRIKMISGQRAIETLDKSENSNFDFRDYRSDIPVNLQDTRTQAKYAFATIDGAAVTNIIEEAMNSGKEEIYALVEAEVTNAQNTLIRLIANALRAASPSSTDPESIQSIIQDAAAASQTGSTGELARNTTYWFNQYSATAMDLSSTGGYEALLAFMLQDIAKGNSRLDAPDFGLTTGTLFAALSAGHGDALRRFGPNDSMLKLGFNNIVVNGATIMVDPSITAGDLYLVNTNHMHLQVLKTPGQKDMGDRPQTMPISVRPFDDAYNSLNRASIMYLTFALTCSSLQRQGIASNCS